MLFEDFLNFEFWTSAMLRLMIFLHGGEISWGEGRSIEATLSLPFAFGLW